VNIICVIPARMGSSRFPNKPLAIIDGLPMLAHVAFRCKFSKSISKLIVATCDKEIMSYCESIGIESVMTSNKHERASDRVQEAVEIVEKDQKLNFDVVLMVQGDEPLVTPEMLDLSIDTLKISGAEVVNLMSKIDDLEEWLSPNCVKVVTSLQKEALYFSREPIPSGKKSSSRPVAFKQVCIIPFKRKFLDLYSSLKPTYLEEVESVDMNRVLEHGYRIACAETFDKSYPVDVPSDIKRVEEALGKCPLRNKY
jgi:3-deoxy-manno-octulosonate cytidylyltransferase (CMP-KDO synthetase)